MTTSTPQSTSPPTPPEQPGPMEPETHHYVTQPLVDDLGPDDDLELDLLEVEVHAPNPRAELGLVVSFTPEQTDALAVIARRRGISMIDAVERLVEEGIERRGLLSDQPAQRRRELSVSRDAIAAAAKALAERVAAETKAP